MTEASFQAAGYTVLIEDDSNQKYILMWKTYAPVVYGSKSFIPSHFQMPIYAKVPLATYLALRNFGHNFWGAANPTIIMIHSKSVTRFFPNPNHTASTLKCVYFCITIQLSDSTHSWENEHCGRFSIKNRSGPDWRKNSSKNTKRQNSQTYGSQHRINRHRTRRTSLQYRRWPDRNPWTKNLATQIWRSQYQIQATSGHNNRVLLTHWPTQGTVNYRYGAF